MQVGANIGPSLSLYPIDPDARPIDDAAVRPGRRALDRQDWPAVQRFCHKRLRKSAKDHFGHRYLGTALMVMKRPEEARDAFEAALCHFPNDPVVLINYADMLCARMDYDRAYDMAKRATTVAPHLVKGWVITMTACYMTGRHQEAVSIGQDLLQQTLDNETRQVVLNNLGINLRDLGRLDEALLAVQKSVQINPAWLPPYMNQLLFMLSMPQVSAMDMRQVADQYAHYCEGPYKAQWPRFHDRDANPHRRLRVGLLSPDFNAHSVMYFVEGLLPQMDRRQFEVIALYLQTGEHLVTQRVRRHCDEFHPVHGLDDATLAHRLQALNIDILIDLAGHTAASGLGAMARKPAPVQVTWLGFPGTTGLTAIDWRITDGIADAPGSEQEYSEKLWRLPDIYCVYRPMSRFPLYRYQPNYRVRPSPALVNGYITFGSCNNLSKLTDAVLRTWGKVLAAVADSRLLVEGKGFEDAQARADFQLRCEALGIPAERLQMVPRHSDNQYLTYHEIDIALDPFPLTGGTTTFDLLWMGLPMVTMRGDSFRSRMGMSLLQTLGETGWIAEDDADYVRIARELAHDIADLNARRLQQRQHMERSPLMDEARFTREFGHALRQMWYRWCAEQQCGDDAAGVTNLIQRWSQHQWPALPPQVTVSPGQVFSLHEAHQHLQALTAEALRQAPREELLKHCTEPPEVSHEAWFKVLDWCEYLLDSIPNEPLALATLAELEHAHGRTAHAATYLHYAQEALQQ